MLMTSRRPKMMVRPNATSTTATPSASPVIICGARTNWIYSRNTVIRHHLLRYISQSPRSARAKPPDSSISKSLAVIGADRIGAADIANDLELPAGDPYDIHWLYGLMISRAHRLFALGRHPFQPAHGFPHLVGLGRLGLFYGRLVEIDQTIAVGAVKIGIGVAGRLERLDELLVFGCVDLRRIADAGPESFGRRADGSDVLRRHSARGADDQKILGKTEVLHLRHQPHGVVAGDRRI